MKRCRKMKRRQRAHLDIMGRKRDTMSIGGEAAPGRKKGGDDASWVGVNLTEKIKKIYTVDSVAINGR
jgi:hypothetical protein